MKIYAIRDRMLNYFQVPVVVHRVEDLIAAIARGINSTGDDRNEIAQAPDHYELWEIGEIDDQGHINAKHQLIANCASFVRNGVWKRRAEGADGTALQPGSLQDRPGHASGPGGARPGLTASTQRAAPIAPQKPDTNAGGGDPGGEPGHSQR